MRENRLSGSEGGGTGTTRSPYPYAFGGAARPPRVPREQAPRKLVFL